MRTDLYHRFEDEIGNFWVLALLNLVFAAITMAFGILFIVTKLEEVAASRTISPLQIGTLIVGAAAFVLGIWWLRSSAGIFRSVREIRSASGTPDGDVTRDEVTELSIQMLARYRENRPTIRTMILVCMAGGFCFLGLGVLNSIRFVTGFRVQEIGIDYALVSSILIFLALAAASLLISFSFRRYATVWDARLDKLARTEEALKKTMESDRR